MTRMVALFASLTLLLAACGGGAEEPAAKSSPTEADTRPAIEKDATYVTVDQLKNAAVAAGFVCINWTKDTVADAVGEAAESGSCSENDVFATFTSDESRDTTVANIKDFADMTESDVSVLVGPNWIINATNVSILSRTLGGTLVTR